MNILFRLFFQTILLVGMPIGITASLQETASTAIVPKKQLELAIKASDTVVIQRALQAYQDPNIHTDPNELQEIVKNVTNDFIGSLRATKDQGDAKDAKNLCLLIACPVVTAKSKEYCLRSIAAPYNLDPQRSIQNHTMKIITALLSNGTNPDIQLSSGNTFLINMARQCANLERNLAKTPSSPELIECMRQRKEVAHLLMLKGANQQIPGANDKNAQQENPGLIRETQELVHKTQATRAMLAFMNFLNPNDASTDTSIWIMINMFKHK